EERGSGVAATGAGGAEAARATAWYGRQVSVFLSRWRPQHLLLSWVGYWLAISLVAISPALPLLWRISRSADGKGSISANFGGGGWSLRVTAGAETWVGTTSALQLALWLAIPPLLLWGAWMLARPHGKRRLAADGSVPALPPR